MIICIHLCTKRATLDMTSVRAPHRVLRTTWCGHRSRRRALTSLYVIRRTDGDGDGSSTAACVTTTRDFDKPMTTYNRRARVAVNSRESFRRRTYTILFARYCWSSIPCARDSGPSFPFFFKKKKNCLRTLSGREGLVRIGRTCPRIRETMRCKWK